MMLDLRVMHLPWPIRQISGQEVNHHVIMDDWEKKLKIDD